VPGKKGEWRLARLRELIRRAQARCGARAADRRDAHGRLVEIGRCLEPPSDPAPTGARVRAAVEARLDEIDAAIAVGRVPDWLRGPVAHVGGVLRRLGDGLYRCYDVPGLPPTNNEQERFYRRIKAGHRRTTGRRRADSFVVRVGGFAAYATAASTEPEAEVLRRLATVPAPCWEPERAARRAAQERQATMRRFRLRRAAYLADLETRWERLTEPP
jgi:hypothetical protein